MYVIVVICSRLEISRTKDYNWHISETYCTAWVILCTSSSMTVQSSKFCSFPSWLRNYNSNSSPLYTFDWLKVKFYTSIKSRVGIPVGPFSLPWSQKIDILPTFDDIVGIIRNKLTLVLLNPDIPCLCKQCRSRSFGFWRWSQLIWICTVCH